jgi:formylglycine-generating enzyme required for sulfatase activity
VEEVSYTAITTATTGFLALLNAEMATICPLCPTGYVFRLPTEAEWEYACRAGTTSSWYWGDSDASITNYAWYDDNSQLGANYSTQPVGMLLPNAWGLYDMAGNVWEWCQDYYSSSYFTTAAQTDPAGPTSGSSRVLRGGSLYIDSGECRSAYRAYISPDDCSEDQGFRVVLAPPRTP